MKSQETQPQAPSEKPRSPFEVVAIVASAGGLEALSAVLRDLPPDLPAGVLVMQHLSGRGSSLEQILRRRTRLPIAWIEDGGTIAPGEVRVCPPGKRLEVLPDATFALSPGSVVGSRPLDYFLESLADSFGQRALAVVLTGMGKDGAAGARAVKQAGGTVIVQSEETAEQPSMPHAAIETGAADLVLHLYEIGPVLADVLAGGKLPRPRSEIEVAEALFAGPGEHRALLRAFDWSTTPLGPVSSWPEALRLLARMTVDSPFPMALLWGPDLIQIYNQEWRAFLGSRKHSAALGGRMSETWSEVWPTLGPMLDRAKRGESVSGDDSLLLVERSGFPEECYFTFSYSPIRDASGAILGLQNTGRETTPRVLAERRLRTLRRLATIGAEADTPQAVCARAAEALADNPGDVSFALLYLLDESRGRVTLAAATGLEAGSFAAPRLLFLAGGASVWPLSKIVRDGDPVVVDDLPRRFRGLPTHSTGTLPPETALLLPLRLAADEPIVGVLVIALSPHRPLDELYRDFLDLAAAQVGASLAEARTRQRERERLERLAELDRTKIEFFSNVSHEFRTPLTLLLAPLEELLRHREDLPAPLAEEIEVACRNARRLLGLVNTLLDFSQIEAGRLRVHFEPTDLSALTAEIASVFHGAAERAGLRLHVDCPPLPAPVWVDQEMWEKVVSNLLSNALKFTFQGEIVVELRARPSHAELVVRDTGVGIPREELPHVFQRFHRVRGAKARTHEGAGIGLALVHELVRRHHGRVRVQSKPGEGTTFTVWIPSGRRAAGEPTPERVAPGGTAAALAEEAVRWDVQDQEPQSPGIMEDPLGPPAAAPLRERAPGARVLVVDDHADLRDYLRRLLSAHWEVETASHGEEALERARRSPPDLILADVMTPSLDGFGLLREVRQDEALKATPVVLLTARAGEEAAIEGLLAGADDYIVKPFSARELVARLGAQIELSRVRRRAEAAMAADLADTRLLRELSVRLLSEDDLQVSYQEIVEAAIRLTQADAGTVQILDESTQELVLLATQGIEPEMKDFFHRVSAGSNTPCGIALARGDRTFIDFDVPEIEDPDGSLRRHLADGFLSAQSTPLIARSGRILGSVSTHWRTHRRPTERELSFLDLLARQAADLIERRQQEEALAQARERLEQRVAERTAALHDAEERFHALVEASAPRVWATDPEGRGVALRDQEVNENTPSDVETPEKKQTTRR